MIRILTVVSLLAAMIVAPALAEDEPKFVDVLPAWSWSAWGAPTAMRDDASVPGGKALRIAVRASGDKPWEAMASANVGKPIRKGDVVLLAFWARAEVPAAGRTTVLVPNIALQLQAAPHTNIADASAEVGPAWKQYYASGTADRDYAPGTLVAALQLAGATQTIDLGPVSIIDLGPGYDLAKLPKNDLVPPPGVYVPVPTAAFAAAETRYAGELARLRALLPVRGLLMNDPSESTTAAYGPDQTHQQIAAPEVPGGQALRVAVTKAGVSYGNGLRMTVYGDVHKGDVLFLAFYARVQEASDPSGMALISGYGVQQIIAPWSTVVGNGALVPPGGWRVFYASAVAAADFPAGTIGLTASCGGRVQTIDFGPAFVLNLGPGVDRAKLPVTAITYPGREANAPWRAAAQQRIRQIRMGDLRVTVTDATGKPVPGAEVHVAMTRHAFRFGTFVGHNLVNGTGPDADNLRRLLLADFNFATSPVFTADWGWANPQSRANYTASMKWLQDHGYGFRAHTIVYAREDTMPASVISKIGDPAAVHDAIIDLVRAVAPEAARYGAYAIDVVNEPRDGTTIPKIAGDNIYADAFKTAHRLAPNVELFVNEANVESGGGHNERAIAFYHRFIEDLQAKGAPVGGIGFQGHFDADLTDPARVIELMDEFARYRLPIEITEFDVNTPDEAAQADYTRDMLTAVFSHPAADAFVMWGIWEGDHWKADAAMHRRDWSEKPNYKVWKQTIFHDWWTDERRIAGPDGTASLRAFYGDYKITVTAGGRTMETKASFGPQSAPLTVVLR